MLIRNRKKFEFFLAFIFIIFFINLFSFAGSPGATSGNFLNYSPSPRGSGMSDAFSSVCEDAYASYYNPAALVNVEVIEFGATYNKSFEDISNQFVSVAYPYKPGRVFAFSYSGLSYGEIQGYDAVGTATKKISASDKNVAFSYGRALTKDEIERPVLSVGATLKNASENLDSASASAFAFDFGALYSLRPNKYWVKEIPAQEFRFSAVIKNLGTKMKFDKEAFDLPRSLNLGAAWLSHPWGAHRLILSAESVLSNYDKHILRLGAEYLLFQLVAVRAGYQTNKYIGSKINFGIGFKLSFVDIDYSMTPFGDLGSMQKIGISAKFGYLKSSQPLKGEVARVKDAKLVAPKEKIEKLQEFAMDYVKLAEKNINEKEYLSAYDNLDKAFNLEPKLKDGKWGKVSNRLGLIIDSLRLREMPEKIKILSQGNAQSDLADKAIKAYINSEDLKSFLLAHISYGTNIKGNSFYEELLYSIGELIRMSVRSDEILPKDSWITQKLKKSAGYFYVKQYNMVIKECEEILLVDENNYLAWTRAGSAYFMLGDKEKARASYERALAINPNDIMTLKFMQAQGWK
jgi:tetratricopeptide (TPR) repeat protein